MLLAWLALINRKLRESVDSELVEPPFLFPTSTATLYEDNTSDDIEPSNEE
jgi:hypothetical protein